MMVWSRGKRGLGGDLLIKEKDIIGEGEFLVCPSILEPVGLKGAGEFSLALGLLFFCKYGLVALFWFGGKRQPGPGNSELGCIGCIRME